MADRLTDFIHKCMKHGGVEGSVSFAKPNGYSVLASTDTLTFDVEVQDDHVVDFFYSGRGDLTDKERTNIFWLWNEVVFNKLFVCMKSSIFSLSLPIISNLNLPLRPQAMAFAILP